MAARENCCNSRNTFWVIFGVTQFFGLLAIALMVIWTCVFNGGYKWNGRYHQFAIHPLVMILSMVFLYGNAALIYRALDCVPRWKTKFIHMIITGITLALAIFGVATVFIFDHRMNYGNMYTMHSWCGITTLGFFTFQFFAGFFAFMWPGVKGSIRDMVLPIHRFGAFAILALSLGSIMSGIVDDLLLSMKSKEYRELPPHAIFFNVIGLLCMAYILLTMYLLHRNDWNQGAPLPPPPQFVLEEAQEQPGADPTPVPETSGPGELEKLLPHPR